MCVFVKRKLNNPNNKRFHWNTFWKLFVQSCQHIVCCTINFFFKFFASQLFVYKKLFNLQPIHSYTCMYMHTYLWSMWKTKNKTLLHWKQVGHSLWLLLHTKVSYVFFQSIVLLLWWYARQMHSVVTTVLCGLKPICLKLNIKTLFAFVNNKKFVSLN